MKPILFTSNQELNPNDFEDHLMQLCTKHKEDDRALAFLMYDFQDYTIKKIVTDKDYWVTLDSISGKYLTIFYIDSQDSYFETRQKEILAEEQKHHLDKNTFGFIQSDGIKATPLDKVLLSLRKSFSIKEEVNTPFVLFFQTRNLKIIDSFVVSLHEVEKEKAFLELRRIIDSSMESISKLQAYDQEIFDTLRYDVERSAINHVIETGVKDLRIRSVISIFKLFGSMPF